MCNIKREYQVYFSFENNNNLINDEPDIGKDKYEEIFKAVLKDQPCRTNSKKCDKKEYDRNYKRIQRQIEHLNKYNKIVKKID